MEEKQRCEPRYPFIASPELLEENSGPRMNSRFSDLSLNGRYVDTVNPLLTETHSLEAAATVVYSQAFLGRSMKFGEVPPKSEEVLRLWRPETTDQTKQTNA
jgi:hypothetical protein